MQLGYDPSVLSGPFSSLLVFKLCHIKCFPEMKKLHWSARPILCVVPWEVSLVKGPCIRRPPQPTSSLSKNVLYSYLYLYPGQDSSCRRVAPIRNAWTYQACDATLMGSCWDPTGVGRTSEECGGGGMALAKFPQVCCHSGLHPLRCVLSGWEEPNPQKCTEAACTVSTRFA